MSENPMFDKPGQPQGQPQGQPGGQPQGEQPAPPQYGQPQYGQPQGQPGGQQGYGAPQQPAGYPPAPAYGAAPVAGPLNSNDEKLWGGMAHWGSLVLGFLTGLAFLAPLLVMVIKGNQSAWVRRNAVESLNFQLTMLIAGAVAWAVGIALFFLIVPLLLPLAVGAFWLVFTIIGSIKSVNGEEYRYPMTFRMVS